MQRLFRGRLRCGWRVVALVAVAAMPRVSRAAQSEILFFDPDANHQALSTITKLFTEYISTATAEKHRLRPVQHQQDFEKLASANESKFAIVSSSYLRDSPNRKFTPIMVPSAEGKVTFRKVLVLRANSAEKDLSRQTIAVTIAGSNVKAIGDQVLAVLAKSGIKTEGARILKVSKDVDGLLGLAFGRVGAALVRPHTLEVLKRINPAMVGGLQVVFKTNEILYSPFCLIEGRSTPEEREKIIGALKQMNASETGRQALKFLAFDDWVPFEAWMLKK